MGRIGEKERRGWGEESPSGPQKVLGNKISVSDIDGLKIFKFYEHPKIHA
jgi:hypothetical protein